MVQDRVFLALLFIVGGSSLVWGLYLLFYVSQNSPSGIFNSVLGLLVLFVTWAYLVPYVLPSRATLPLVPSVTSPLRPAPPRAALGPPVRSPARPAAGATPRAAPAPPLWSPTPEPSPSSAPPSATRFARPARPTTSAADVFAAPLPRPTPSPPRMDPEIESLLSDLPSPADEPTGAGTPDEMVDRLDALQRDLSEHPTRRAPGAAPGL
jgi:hypothetical protein